MIESKTCGEVPQEQNTRLHKVAVELDRYAKSN